MTLKKFSWNSSQIVHMAFKELLRLSDGLANLCRGSTWSPTEQLVKDSYPLINHSLIMQTNFTWMTTKFFTIFNFKIYWLSKKKFVREFSCSTHGTQRVTQTLRWSCEPIILSIGHFESRTEVQLNSWQKVSGSDCKTV